MSVEAGAEEISKELNDPVIEKSPAHTPTPEQQPYSIYTRGEKWWLVAIVALAGFLSPLPATIYFPAIPQLTKVFNESTEAVNTTVTVYLVFQGLGPMLWGPLSDQWGRRPVILICLGILTLSCVGLALTPTDAFWLLFLMRCFQSAGCASTIALGAGLIGDIAEREDRGGFMGMFSAGPMVATSIAPVIGGALAQAMGWRAIFWFLVIFAGVSTVFIMLFLPETLRALVGNGSIRSGPFHKPIIQLFGRGKQTQDRPIRTGKRKPFQNPFVILTYPDVIITQAFTGIIYAVWYAVTATISSTFDEVYPWLSETEIGLCYLSMGGGMLIGSMSTGKLLDWEYRRLRRGHERANDEAQFGRGKGKYSIEVVRLRLMPAHVLLKAICEIGWGWCLDQDTHIAAPLVLQFMIGYCSIATLNTTMTLMIDILPNQSSASAACTNFVRCSLASVMVACINLATRKLGIGPTYTLLGGIELLMVPAMFLQMRVGPDFRMKRDAAKEIAAAGEHNQ